MPLRRYNVQAGMMTAHGFVPFRSSRDYDPDRAGDEYEAYSDATGAEKYMRKPAKKRAAAPKRKRARAAAPRRKASTKRKRNSMGQFVSRRRNAGPGWAESYPGPAPGMGKRKGGRGSMRRTKAALKQVSIGSFKPTRRKRAAMGFDQVRKFTKEDWRDVAKYGGVGPGVLHKARNSRTPKLDATTARHILKEVGSSPDTDFDTLYQGQVSELLDWADKYAYRKPVNASGSRGRYFHAYLVRLAHRKNPSYRRTKKAFKTMVRKTGVRSRKGLKADYRAVGKFVGDEKRYRRTRPWARTRTRKRNVPGDIDQASARELDIFIDNNRSLHDSQYMPIIKNLATKKARGVYNHALAVKLFRYLVDNGDKMYHAGVEQRHRIPPGAKVQTSTATRNEVAEGFVRHFETEYDLGNYDYLLPKKYQKKTNPCTRYRNPGEGGTRRLFGRRQMKVYKIRIGHLEMDVKATTRQAAMNEARKYVRRAA